MRTTARTCLILFAGLLWSATSVSVAQAQWSSVYPGPWPEYGNYAPTMYANSGRPSRRTAAYMTYRPHLGQTIDGGYIVAPTYALPGLAPFRPQPTTSYYRAPATFNTTPSPYGYDYHLNYPAGWFNGYWGW